MNEIDVKMNIQTIKNVSDCVPLYLPHSLYLKPFAKFNVSVSLPQATTGKAISNWDVMEKLRHIILPDQFSVLKVSKSTLEFIRFEAELEDFAKLKDVLSRLDGRTLKLANFSEPVKIRAAQAKDDFPSRHKWDKYFRDSRDMDEMKWGERPDTMHISNLPIRWFCPRHQENDDVVKPSESIFKRIFEKFGDVRMVDIPICDPYRKEMKPHMSGMKTFSFDQELYFEGYIQFSEYAYFVKAMDEFRGMKLVRKEGDKNLALNIVVDFDRTKHLSDASVKRRKIVRDKFIAKDRAKEEDEKRKIQLEEEKQERQRRQLEEQRMVELDKQRLREEQRKEKHLKKLREKEQHDMSSKIRSEEKKLLIAQRKLESIRVLEALFDRIKLNTNHKIKVEGSKVPKHRSGQIGTTDLRNKLMNRFKSSQEIELERQKNRVKKVRNSGILGLALKGGRSRSPSVNTISSDDSVFNAGPKKKKKKKLKKKNEGDSSTSSSSDDEISPKPSTGMMAPPPGAFPMFNPETGQWMGMSMGMGMYPYNPFLAPLSAPMVRPDYFQNAMSYRGYRGGPRGRYPRSRGRGNYRGRGGYHDGDYKYENDGYDDTHDHRRKYSRSRSRSHSRSRRSRSRSRSSSSRSRSRSRNRRSKSHSRSKSRSRSKTKKLVSTLRKSRSSRDWSSRSRSRSKSRRSKRSWSRDATNSKSRSRSRKRRSRSRSRKDSVSAKRIVLQPEKLVRSAKEIQRTVQQKLHEQVLEEERAKQLEKNRDYQRVTERPQLIPATASSSGGTPPQLYQKSSRSRSRSKSKSKSRSKRSRSKSRSKSVHSAEFVSPKRRNDSVSP